MPPGAAPPITPATVAVKVTLCPKVLVGFIAPLLLVTVTVGVAMLTVSVIAIAVALAVKFMSPP